MIPENIPLQFKQGVRILMLTLRGKEGGKITKPDRVSKKVISRNETEFDAMYEKLSLLRKGEERIYSTVDERNMEKAIRSFKERQLEADYYDQETKFSFYTDVWNRWISCLQSPKAKNGTLFLIDIDDEGENAQNVGKEEQIRQEIIKNSIEIVFEYPTKNGKHIITKPFNPALVSFQIQKNAMMLLKF